MAGRRARWPLVRPRLGGATKTPPAAHLARRRQLPSLGRGCRCGASDAQAAGPRRGVGRLVWPGQQRRRRRAEQRQERRVRTRDHARRTEGQSRPPRGGSKGQKGSVDRPAGRGVARGWRSAAESRERRRAQRAIGWAAARTRQRGPAVACCRGNGRRAQFRSGAALGSAPASGSRGVA